jgi:hypothetical protein
MPLPGDWLLEREQQPLALTLMWLLEREQQPLALTLMWLVRCSQRSEGNCNSAVHCQTAVEGHPGP